MNRLRQKFTTFSRQSRLTKALLIPAWCLLGISRLMVLLLPFKWLAPLVGRYNGVAPFLPIAGSFEYQRAMSIGRAVRMAATVTPWQANCQPQAITARFLLGLFSVPYAVFYGVANAPEQNMQAHAWVGCGPVPVTGGYAFDQFTVVAVFASAVPIDTQQERSA